MGIIQYEQFGPWIYGFAHCSDPFQEIFFHLIHANPYDVSTSDDGGVNMDGKGRCRDQDRIPRSDEGQA